MIKAITKDKQLITPGVALTIENILKNNQVPLWILGYQFHREYVSVFNFFPATL